MAKINFTGNVLSVSGNLVFATAMDLLKASRVHFSVGANITVDLSAVTHTDSAGLALLCELQRLAAERKIQLSFQNIPQQLLRMAEVSHVKEILSLS